MFCRTEAYNTIHVHVHVCNVLATNTRRRAIPPILKLSTPRLRIHVPLCKRNLIITKRPEQQCAAFCSFWSVSSIDSTWIVSASLHISCFRSLSVLCSLCFRWRWRANKKTPWRSRVGKNYITSTVLCWYVKPFSILFSYVLTKLLEYIYSDISAQLQTVSSHYVKLPATAVCL